MLNRRVFLKSLAGLGPMLVAGSTSLMKSNGFIADEKTLALQMNEHPIKSELRDMWIEFDPIGVMNYGCPRDEYDAYLDPTLHYLERSVPAKELGNYLEWATSERMKSPVSNESLNNFAVRLQQWFAERWGNNRS